jgi:hypothetical protein
MSRSCLRPASAAMLLALVPCAVGAQGSPAPQTSPASTAAYNACLLSAIASEDIYKDEAGVQFRCFGQAAETWFNQLPDGREVPDKNGVFVARYFGGSGYCAHQIKSATGQPVSIYLCAIDKPLRQ